METNRDYYRLGLSDIKKVLKNIIEPKVYEKVSDLNVSFYKSDEPVPFAERKKGNYLPIHEGEVWSKKVFDCAWFHLLGDIAEADNLYLRFDCGGEALLFGEAGSAIKGFTNGSSTFDRFVGGEPGKEYYPLKGLDKLGHLDLWIDAGSNDLFGSLAGCGVFSYAEVVKKNEKLDKVRYDYEVLLDLAEHLPFSSPRFQAIFSGLLKAKNAFLYNKDDAISIADKVLSPLLKEKSSDSTKIIAVGHAHLDLIWLWPLRETKRKVLRTYSNMVYLMDKYPDFTYLSSQPQQLEWIREEDPKLFAKIQNLEKEKRLELVGGSWVESDTNLIGGESLIRQFLYGQRFYKQYFGHYVKVNWLPDTFGYSASLPQLLKKSEQPYFSTIKISWCNYTVFPYHSFRWIGNDGSGVLTHLPPEGNYLSSLKPSALLKAESNIHACDYLKEGLMPYGIGDGGGGPGEEHLERLEREKNLAPLPKVAPGHAIDIFNDLEQVRDKLKTHKGEMFLENHHGTYTSQSRNKQYNRDMEIRLEALEALINAMGKDFSSFQDELDSIWKEVLLYQFHDALPGSSIRRVYEETDKAYERMEKEIDGLFARLLPGYTHEFHQGSFPLCPYENPLRKIIVKGDKCFVASAGPWKTGLVNEFALTEEKTSRILTKNLDIELDEKRGGLRKVVGRHNGHTLLSEGDSLRVYQDLGDAWNILESYRDGLQEGLVLESRNMKGASGIHVITNHYSFRSSSVVETIVIDEETDLIEFRYEVNWQDTGYMLRSYFNSPIKSDSVICSTQYGYIKRSTKMESMHEKGQFEINALYYIARENGEDSIALINRAKNGYYAKGDVLEINLLRSTNYPCVDSDHLPTSFTYGLVLKEGPFSLTDVADKAMSLNRDLLYYTGEPLPLNGVMIDNPSIRISAWKNGKGESSVLRLSNLLDKKQDASISLPTGYALLKEVDLLEENVDGVLMNPLRFGPFEVRTFLIGHK